MNREPHAREMITVVDEHDNVIGAEDRKIVREKGLYHRIIRVIITNPQGQILIQKRPDTMQDSPSLWDWSASGHVDAGEDYLDAALREIEEEVRITDARLELVGKYYREFKNDTVFIRRFNAVYTGQTDQTPHRDEYEVAAIKWVTPAELTDWIKSTPADFTSGVTKVIDLYGDKINVSR